MQDTPERRLAAARSIARQAGELAEETDRARRIGPDAVKAIAEAGFMRHFTPVRFGGRAGGFGELLDTVPVIGAACPATAWCASLFAGSPRFLSFFPEEGQAQVWADGPDAAVIASVIPFGEAVPEGDGLRVTGRWPYMSGIDHADWVIVCAKVPAADGGQRLLLAVVPRSQCRVEDTWSSVGMRGTGSNTAVLEDVFVPAARIADRAAAFAGRPADPAAVPPVAGLAPLPAVNGLTFVAPALGAARGTLALVTEALGGRSRAAAVPGIPGAAGNQASYDMLLARSAAEIDAAGLLLGRVAELADADRAPTPAETARNVRDSAFVVDTLVTAVNRLYRAAGTSGQVADGPLQRLWRDVNAIATHQALQFEPAARLFAQTR
ncbi:hydrolase [Kitasatospora sp. NPDC059146]|uniref:hydrolase n=1 Tax=unclassified Kitasatospora TaxID=2633591 RepID=UPI0036946A92